eukprot:9449102-Heterocapsa_arctica.AAC.1
MARRTRRRTSSTTRNPATTRARSRRATMLRRRTTRGVLFTMPGAHLGMMAPTMRMSQPLSCPRTPTRTASWTVR